MNVQEFWASEMLEFYMYCKAVDCTDQWRNDFSVFEGVNFIDERLTSMICVISLQNITFNFY